MTHKSALLLLTLFVFLNTFSQKQPNIILIMADDLGWGDIGFNGQDKIKTPNIDQLAKEGIVFNHFYAGSTVCGPSRASLMTGKHTGHGTVRGNPKWTSSGKPVDIKDDEITIAEVLKKAGYNTAVIGKWALAENLQDARPNRQGFDYFYGFNLHRTAHHYYPDSIYLNENKIRIEGNDVEKKEKHYIQDLFTEKAKEYLNNSHENPFFLYLAYTVPHYELTVPEDSKAQYRKENWPLRKMKRGHYYHDQNGHVTYAGMVSRMDRHIGELMQLLKKRGMDKNTLVIFTSDHGHEYDQLKNEFFNSNGPFKGKKRDLYEGGLRVPFIAKWPKGIKAGSSTDHIGAFWDILPTFSDLAKNKTDLDTDGISFVNALKGKDKKQAQHDYLYWEFNEGKGPIQAIRKDNWKLVKRYNMEIELYDLSIDIGENNNVASKHPELLVEMKQLLENTRTEHPQFPLIKLR